MEYKYKQVYCFSCCPRCLHMPVNQRGTAPRPPFPPFPLRPCARHPAQLRQPGRMQQNGCAVKWMLKWKLFKCNCSESRKGNLWAIPTTSYTPYVHAIYGTVDIDGGEYSQTGATKTNLLRSAHTHTDTEAFAHSGGKWVEQHIRELWTTFCSKQLLYTYVYNLVIKVFPSPFVHHRIDSIAIIFRVVQRGFVGQSSGNSRHK